MGKKVLILEHDRYQTGERGFETSGTMMRVTVRDNGW
jgi:hypothetical protein